MSTDRSATYPGGKGTNQAVGAARLGHRVSLVGSVGDDLDAVSIYQALAEHGVSAEGVQRCPGRETGKAYIFVDPEGESMISILSGANRQLTPQRLREQAHLFARTGYCLIQTEIPMDAVYEACRLARESGAKTILKPSACRELPPALLELVDILVPNSDELREICPQEDSLPNRARRLLEQGAGTVIVTLGARAAIPLPDRRSDSTRRRIFRQWTTPERATPSSAPWPRTSCTAIPWTKRYRSPPAPLASASPGRAPFPPSSTRPAWRLT